MSLACRCVTRRVSNGVTNAAPSQPIQVTETKCLEMGTPWSLRSTSGEVLGDRVSDVSVSDDGGFFNEQRAEEPAEPEASDRAPAPQAEDEKVCDDLSDARLDDVYADQFSQEVS